MIITPTDFEGFNRVLTGVVVPRPIAFISTASRHGVVNLAPFSFFNAFSSHPPTLVIGISRHADWKDKDTLSNIEVTREFVVNVVTEDIAQAMNKTAAEYPESVSEFEIAGLTPRASSVVKPPSVNESPVNMECRLNQVLKIGDGREESGIVVGEIVSMSIRDDIIEGHRINHQNLKPVGRLAGSMYCHTYDVFEMIRPVFRPED